MNGYAITFFNVDSDEIDYLINEDDDIVLIGYGEDNQEACIFIDSNKMTVGYLFDEILPILEYRLKKSMFPILINHCYYDEREIK